MLSKGTKKRGVWGDTPLFAQKYLFPIGSPLSHDSFTFSWLVHASLIIHCTTSLLFSFSNLAAYSDILPEHLQDLTNYVDDLPQNVRLGHILDAARYVLGQDNTAEWIVDMLTLTKYYRVNFKKRSTVQKFLRHLNFLAEHKENEVYTQQQIDILHKITTDLTKWIDQRKSDCLDDNHWPVSAPYMWSLRGIYDAFPDWKDEQYFRVAD